METNKENICEFQYSQNRPEIPFSRQLVLKTVNICPTAWWQLQINRGKAGVTKSPEVSRANLGSEGKRGHQEANGRSYRGIWGKQGVLESHRDVGKGSGVDSKT